MNLEMSTEHAAFREEVRAFIQARLPDEIRQRLRQGHLPSKEDTVRWQRILAERGWAAPHWPRAYGGAELGQMERLILNDELQRAPAPVPQVFNINMLGPVLLKFGTPAQCDYFLPRLVNLDLWFCQGFSEPGAGSDLASLRTSAKRDGEHYVVNGQKAWTSTAQWSDWMFALVRTEADTRKQEGISFLLIDLKSPGISIRPVQSIDGSYHLNEVFLDEVRVPVDNLVGEENKGWDCAKFLLANERSGIANVGLCRERLDYARELARNTVRAGRPLAEHPGLRQEMVWLDAQIRALELSNLRFLLSPRAQAAVPAFASILKLKGTELQQDVNALLARLTGLAGLEHHDAQDESGCEVHLVERYLFARATSIYGGSSEIQKEILAKSILG
jgi:pimeloyl-CoA dehydrogenase